MKIAIRTSTGEIIKIGESIESLLNYQRVNPLSSIVKKTKNGWVAVDKPKN